MDEKEVGLLLNYVRAGYPHFLRDNDPKIVFDLWYRSLKEFEFQPVLDNLIRYMKTSEYPPKIKDLVEGLVVNEKYNIPGIEETKKILDSYIVPESERASKEKIEALKRKYWGDVQ